MKRLNGLDGLALILVIIGAINWGLVGATHFNVVDTLFGAGSALSRIVYVLVGLSGVYVALASPWFARTTHREEVRTGGMDPGRHSV